MTVKKIYSLVKHSEKEALTYFDENIRQLPKKRGEIDTYSSDLHNNDADAFRHAYVSGVLTQKYGRFGEKIAAFLGGLYEIDGRVTGQPLEEENMDLWNNRVGRKYGRKTKSKLDLANALKDALEDGELITTIDQNIDKREYSGFLTSKVDADKPVIVIGQEQSGVNNLFLDAKEGLLMTREEFNQKIQAGLYAGCSVVESSKNNFPRSLPDQSTENNLG
jgi:hypothetical protein